MPSAAPTARLEARISTELHAMLKRAAEMQGRSLTDFVVSAVQEAAQRAIEQGEVVRLSLADSERFAQALLSPPDPSPALERAFARRRKLLRPTSKAQVKTLAPYDPRALLGEDMLTEIRAATNGGFTLGSDRFQREIAAMLGRRTWRGHPGRPRNAEREETQIELPV